MSSFCNLHTFLRSCDECVTKSSLISIEAKLQNGCFKPKILLNHGTEKRKENAVITFDDIKIGKQKMKGGLQLVLFS